MPEASLHVKVIWQKSCNLHAEKGEFDDHSAMLKDLFLDESYFFSQVVVNNHGLQNGQVPMV